MSRLLFNVLSVWFLMLCELSLASPLYEKAINEAENIRISFAESYKADLAIEQKKLLLGKISLEFQRLLTQRLAPFWYGTKWDFHGTSEEPGKGGIACGYFVTTLLRDVGVNLERIALAQQASENIIKSLVSPASIRRFSNKPLSHFLNNVNKWGAGIYIVGLDYHVGFISVESDGTYFIHSSYQAPYAVIRDIASDSQILANSGYRVVGRLSDEKLLGGWLSGAKFETVRR